MSNVLPEGRLKSNYWFDRSQSNSGQRDKNMIEVIETYYEGVYASKTQPFITSNKNLKQIITNINSEGMPDINRDELAKAIKDMKQNKDPGNDNIIPEQMMVGGEERIEFLRILFRKCLQDGDLPNA